MWILTAVPGKMLMVLAIIFGAHLMPYGWLYKSKVHFALPGTIPVAALVVDLSCELAILAAMMIVVEVVFCIGLVIENKR